MAELSTLPCLGCSTPLPPEATGCQICLRGRTKQEIMRGYRQLAEVAARKRRRPFVILAAILIIGAAGRLFMTYGDALKDAGGSALSKVGRWSDDMRNPSNYAPAPAASPSEAPAAPPAPAAPVAPEGALRNLLFTQEGAPAPAPTPAPVAPRPSPNRPLAKNAWRVSGIVYDLSTLDPVADAKLTFLRGEKEPSTATTDDKGEYQIDLPKGDGWTVTLLAPKHRGGQILDLDPPYRVRDGDERRAAFEQLSDGDLTAAQVGWKRAESRVKLDVIAVPHRWSEAPRP